MEKLSTLFGTKLHLMEKGDPAAVELLNEVMRARGWDRSQLADHVGKKRRTIDGIMRGELAMAQDLEKHLQLLLHSDHMGSVVREIADSGYETVKHVIFIEESGSPEQIAAMKAFLKSVREQIGERRSADTKGQSLGKSE